MAYTLEESGGVTITFNPEYDFADERTKIEDVHRTRGGGRFVYRWSDYARFKFGLMYVSPADRTIINNWWNANMKLLFTEVGSGVVYNVCLTNDVQPIGEVIKPYNDLFQGTVELEEY